MPPKKKSARGKKRKSTGKAASQAPPEDLIVDARRAQILAAFQEQIEAMNEEDKEQQQQQSTSQNTDDPQLPLSHAKRALKLLGLEGIKSHEIQDYFGNDDDNPLETLDTDMFLRYAAAKTIQKDKSDKAFQLMDGGSKGIVVIEDLERVAADLGEDLTEEDLQEMIEFVDPSGEGLLTTKHFFKIARQTRL